MSGRTKLIAVVALAAIVAAVLWWSRGGDAQKRAGGAAADDASEVDRSAARPSRSGARASAHDDFGAQFRGRDRVTLRGRVVDAVTREPVPDVEVLFAATGGEASVGSGGDGSFAIELPPGPYDVRAIGDDLYAPSRRVLIGTVDATTLELEVSPLARIHGRVVDPGGAPVAGATVTTHVSKDQQATFEADAMTKQVETAGDGTFTLVAYPGPLYVQAFAVGVGEGVAELHDLVPGDLTEVEIQLRALGSLAGVVQDESGHPVEGVTVTSSLRVPGTPIRQQASKVTGRDGRFLFEDLYAGVSVLDARAPGYGAAPQKIRIAAGERREDVVIALGDAGVLTGRLVDGDGAAISGAKVKIARNGAGMTAGQQRTDGDGRFRFQDLELASYTLTIVQGGRTSYHEIATVPDEPIEIVLRATGRIQGTVMGPQGPTQDFTVTIDTFIPTGGTNPQAAPAPARFVTDDGRFELGPLQPGHYEVSVTAPGFIPTKVAGEVTPDGTFEASVRLQTSP